METKLKVAIFNVEYIYISKQDKVLVLKMDDSLS